MWDQVLSTIRDTNSVKKIWKTCLVSGPEKNCICICIFNTKEMKYPIDQSMCFFLSFLISLRRPSCILFAMRRSDKSRGGKLLFHQKWNECWLIRKIKQITPTIYSWNSMSLCAGVVKVSVQQCRVQHTHTQTHTDTQTHTHTQTCACMCGAVSRAI